MPVVELSLCQELLWNSSQLFLAPRELIWEVEGPYQCRLACAFHKGGMGVGGSRQRRATPASDSSLAFVTGSLPKSAPTE